jgi:hypothetical protein
MFCKSANAKSRSKEVIARSLPFQEEDIVKRSLLIGVSVILVCVSSCAGQADAETQLDRSDSSKEPSPAKITNPTIENVIVYGKKGSFCAWPANSGVWSWRNEILVGFTLGEYKQQRSHNLNRTAPSSNVFSRSLDGGKTWRFEDPKIFADKTRKAQNSQGNIKFAHPDFAMKVGNFGMVPEREDEFLVSYDRGRNWEGPYSFDGLEKAEQLKGFELTSRTDYLTMSRKECLVFKSARSGAFGSDRAFVARTTDGGATFDFLSWIAGPDDPYRAVMPSTVRLSDTKLLSALRRRDMQNKDRNGYDAWVDVFVSHDNGGKWSFLSRVGVTGDWNGNPPAMVKMKDGGLCCVYGNRDSRTINAGYSSDDGKTWSRTCVLRDDYQLDTYKDPDLGYPRLIERPDGKLVAIYYWATVENPHHHIAATIWDPSAHK